MYDLDVVGRQVEALRAALPARFDLAYAVKANPNLAVLRYLASMGLGADVASGGELRHVVRAGFDPAHVGIFTDPGHLSIVGEPIPLALDMVKEYMAAVALKDLIKKQFQRDGKLVWAIDMMPLGMGFGDMDTLFTLLFQQGFPGPVSFHCEYHWMPPESVIDQCRIDVRFINSRIAELGLA